MSGRTIAAAAATIAVLTVLTRLVGFIRTLTFAGAVGSTDLGDMYQTANTIPNLIFEVVAGGALAVIVVPLLAGPVAAADRDRAAGIASALLTWTLALLIPLAALVAWLAPVIISAMAGDPTAAELAVGARMLRVFAIQLPLYGAGIVLTGVLHAHRRFTWPVLAPLVSSLVVIGAYLTFAGVEGAGTDLARVSRTGELVLSVGTTLGVVTLTGCLVPAVWRLRLPLRPRFDLDPVLRRRVVGLAGAAVITVCAQQLTIAVLIRLANGGPAGTLVLFTLAQAAFLLPWAALAVPLSTPAFPVLAAAAEAGDTDRFDRTLARITRAMVLVSCLGLAGLVGLSGPLGRLLAAVTATHPPATTLSAAIAAFAPGLIGLSLFTLWHRALNAAGEARRAAVAAVTGWAATIAVAAVLCAGSAISHRVVVLALANSLGMAVLGATMFLTVRRRRGGAALAGFGRSLAVALAGAVLAGGLGWLVSAGLARLTPGVSGAAATGMLAAAVAVAAYLAVVLVFDRGEVRAMLVEATPARVLSRLRAGRTRSMREGT
ncbi:MAG TPA: lipid II flippase MurJ [Micromonosporaceae bacterium]